MQPTSIHASVREHYAELARTSNSCCSTNELYDDQLLKDLPGEISGFSLGCGDPITLANLRAGETVLDLGSGGGLDCFLASKQVGAAGRVIGVDMTPDMLAKARANAQRLGYPNVEFREGYLEALPVDDNTIDVVISNCVINLSPDKPQVFREVFRALKPGGRIAVSDIVTNGSLPSSVQQSMAAWGACVAGALDVQDYVRGLSAAGFGEVQVQPKSSADQALAALPIGLPFSATITAHKPVSGQPIADLTVQDRVAPIQFAGGRFDALLSQIVSLDTFADGYDVRVSGDSAEIRAQADELAQAVGCCSPLKFSVIDAADGTHVRITSAPDTAFVSLSNIN
ncbi:MAG: arsenite methyltransferase [Thermoflexales bacterium]|nr:arsenite methyltransferase [Thermoflexales bacterium]